MCRTMVRCDGKAYHPNFEDAISRGLRFLYDGSYVSNVSGKCTRKSVENGDSNAEVPDEKVNAGWQRLLTAQNGEERLEHDEDFDGDITLTVALLSIEGKIVHHVICRNTQSLECPLARASSKNVFTSLATLSAYWKRNECPACGYSINCALSIRFKSS